MVFNKIFEYKLAFDPSIYGIWYNPTTKETLDVLTSRHQHYVVMLKYMRDNGITDKTLMSDDVHKYAFENGWIRIAFGGNNISLNSTLETFKKCWKSIFPSLLSFDLVVVDVSTPEQKHVAGEKFCPMEIRDKHRMRSYFDDVF